MYNLIPVSFRKCKVLFYCYTRPGTRQDIKIKNIYFDKLQCETRVRTNVKYESQQEFKKETTAQADEIIKQNRKKSY